EDQAAVTQQQVVEVVATVAYQAHRRGRGLRVVHVTLVIMLTTYGVDRFGQRIGQRDGGRCHDPGEMIGEPADIPGRTMDAASVDTWGYGHAIEDADQVAGVEGVIFVGRPPRSRL